MTKTGLEFVILVIVICLIFDICDLEFLLLCELTPLSEKYAYAALRYLTTEGFDTILSMTTGKRPEQASASI